MDMLRRAFRTLLPFAAEWEIEQWYRFLWGVLAVCACSGAAVVIVGFDRTTSALVAGLTLIVGVPAIIAAALAGIGLILALPLMLLSGDGAADLIVEPAGGFLRSYFASLNRRGPIVWAIMVGIVTMALLFLAIARETTTSSVPTELPNTPTLEKQLSRDGTIPDWRERYTHQLGLMAHYEQCMNGRIKRGTIHYYIVWQIDKDHMASSPRFKFIDEPAQDAITAEDRNAFAACVKAYLSQHDRLYLPSSRAQGNSAWRMGAVFPVSDSPFIKMVSEARQELARARQP